jgi:membrane protein
MPVLRRLVHQLMLLGRIWNRHGCVDLSAAFAFHCLQSFFPFILLCLGVGARIFGHDDSAIDPILRFAEGVLPPGSRDVISSGISTIVRQGRAAGQVGGLVLVISASNATLSLQRGSDRLWLGLWQGKQLDHSWSYHLRDLALQRVKAIGGAVLLTLLFLLNQVTTPFKLLWHSIWASLASWSMVLPELWQVPARSATSTLGSWVGVTLVSLLVLAYLPSRRPRLRYLWSGAVLVSTALTLLNPLLGSSLIWIGSRFLAYGLVGAVILLTLWVWLVGLIIYFGIAWTVALSIDSTVPERAVIRPGDAATEQTT